MAIVRWFVILGAAAALVLCGRDIVLAHFGVPVWSLSTKYGTFINSSLVLLLAALQTPTNGARTRWLRASRDPLDTARQRTAIQTTHGAPRGLDR